MKTMAKAQGQEVHDDDNVYDIHNQAADEQAEEEAEVAAEAAAAADAAAADAEKPGGPPTSWKVRPQDEAKVRFDLPTPHALNTRFILTNETDERD